MIDVYPFYVRPKNNIYFKFKEALLSPNGRLFYSRQAEQYNKTIKPQDRRHQVRRKTSISEPETEYRTKAKAKIRWDI